MRSDQAVERFARKAVAFFRRNGDLRLLHYAIYLGAAVNEELAGLGCPAVRVIVGHGALSAAAEFDAGSWLMALNPSEFSHRPDVETIADLSPDEAAIIAMTVYHEARHAEQHFRVARLLAAEGQETAFDIDPEVAAAAGDAPLEPRAAGALELKEAREWRTNEIGDDATYREAVTSWLREARDAARMARDVDAGQVAAILEHLGALIRGWRKAGGPGGYIRSHLASAKARRASVIVKDIIRIDSQLDRAEAAWRGLDEHAHPAAFKPLADALADLYRAINTAYHDQPVEHDAWDAGDAMFAAFSRRLAAPGPTSTASAHAGSSPPS